MCLCSPQRVSLWCRLERWGRYVWLVAWPLPQRTSFPNMTLCGRLLYVSNNSTVFCCSVEDLLESCRPPSFVYNSKQGSSTVWTRLADIPVPCRSTPETVKGRVLAVGGNNAPFDSKPTGAIHCYDVATNSWSVIGEMPTPRGAALTAVLPNDTLLVVRQNDAICSVAEIGHF